LGKVVAVVIKMVAVVAMVAAMMMVAVGRE
jgi:hypothetical protein